MEHASASALGLPVDTDLPNEVRQLMGLYPQPRGRRPSVEYIPSPYYALPRDPIRRAGPCRPDQGTHSDDCLAHSDRGLPVVRDPQPRPGGGDRHPTLRSL